MSNAESQTQRPDDSVGEGCFSSLLFALLLLAGSVILWALFLKPFALLLEASRWDATPCIIIESQAEPAQRQGDFYKATVRYRYVYKDQTYYSPNIWFVKPGLDARKEIQALVNRYPKGAAFECYVNPADPRQAFLERGFKPELLISIFPLIVAVVGLTGLTANALRRLHPQLPQRIPTSGFAAEHPRSRHVRVAADGTVVYRTPAGAARALALLVFTLLWNGLVSFLVREVVINWSSGVPNCYGWTLTAFSIPFVVGGIALLWATGHTLLRLLNPRPTLVLSRPSVPLGGSIDVSWRLSGRASRLQRLTLQLEGREEATYARGSRLLTDSETFRTITLLDSTDPAQMSDGTASLRMPPYTVPTFQGASNAIVWVLRLSGRIQRRPAIDQELELLVEPLPADPAVVATASPAGQSATAGGGA